MEQVLPRNRKHNVITGRPRKSYKDAEGLQTKEGASITTNTPFNLGENLKAQQSEADAAMFIHRLAESGDVPSLGDERNTPYYLAAPNNSNFNDQESIPTSMIDPRLRSCEGNSTSHLSDNKLSWPSTPERQESLQSLVGPASGFPFEDLAGFDPSMFSDDAFFKA